MDGLHSDHGEVLVREDDLGTSTGFVGEVIDLLFSFLNVVMLSILAITELLRWLPATTRDRFQ